MTYSTVSITTVRVLRMIKLHQQVRCHGRLPAAVVAGTELVTFTATFLSCPLFKLNLGNSEIGDAAQRIQAFMSADEGPWQTYYKQEQIQDEIAGRPSGFYERPRVGRDIWVLFQDVEKESSAAEVLKKMVHGHELQGQRLPQCLRVSAHPNAESDRCIATCRLWFR